MGCGGIGVLGHGPPTHFHFTPGGRSAVAVGERGRHISLWMAPLGRLKWTRGWSGLYKTPHARMQGGVSSPSLISQITLPELAPYGNNVVVLAGCRASQGRFPPPLWIRQRSSVVEQHATRAALVLSSAIFHNFASCECFRGWGYPDASRGMYHAKIGTSSVGRYH